MTNKTIEEKLDRINNIVKLSSSARADIRFILKELLITTIEGIGLGRKEMPEWLPKEKEFTVDNCIKTGELGEIMGYNEYHRKLEAQKKQIIKGLDK